jgi:GC-rich sequence DNA-binding factor
VEDDDADGDEVEKPAVKGEKTGKSGAHNNNNKKKEKASLLKVQEKASGSKLLSFAVEDEEAAEGIGKQQQRSKSVGARVSVAKSGGGGIALSFGAENDGISDGVPLEKTMKKKAGFGLGQGGAAGVGPRAGLTKEVTVTTLSNVQPQAGEYTKEKLLELQRNTKSLGAPPKAPVESKPLEPVLVLKGLVKPSISKNGSALEEGRNGNAMSASVGVAEEEHVHERGLSDVKATDDAESRLGLMGIGTGADSGGITHIPDAAVIAAAKARRNRLRQAQAAPDYIPVDGAEGRGKNRESGLVREQDDEIGKARDREEVESSEDEAEFQTRVAFLGDSVSGRQKQKGGVFQSVNETNANLGSQSEHRDEEEEDEDRRWEEEQLRKGFGKRVEDAAHRGRLVVPEAPSVQGDFKTGFIGGALPSMPAGSAGWGFGRSSMEALSVAQQAAAAMRILQENAHRLRVYLNIHGHTHTTQTFCLCHSLWVSQSVLWHFCTQLRSTLICSSVQQPLEIS